MNLSLSVGAILWDAVTRLLVIAFLFSAWILPPETSLHHMLAVPLRTVGSSSFLTLFSSMSLHKQVTDDTPFEVLQSSWFWWNYGSGHLDLQRAETTEGFNLQWQNHQCGKHGLRDVKESSWRRWLSTSTLLLWDPTWSTASSSGVLSARHGPVGMSPEKAMKVVRGLEHLCCGERLRVGAVQPGEEKALRRSSCKLIVYKGGLQERWRGCFLPGPAMTGQGAAAFSWKGVGLDWP